MKQLYENKLTEMLIKQMGGEITKVVLMCESGYQLKAVRVIIEILLETKKKQ